MTRSALADRVLGFAAVWVCSVAVFWDPLHRLTLLSLRDDRASHLLLIPIISGFLIVSGRTRIFSGTLSRSASSVLLSAGLVLCAAAVALTAPRLHSSLSASILTLVLCWEGAFVFFFGFRCSRAALFPLAFLLLMTPLPETLLHWIVSALQAGSADVAAGIFQAIRMPFFREGLRFSLPGIDIVVAEECSGFRSSISLVVFSILVGHFALPGVWRKLLFTVLAVPVVIFKNGLRIVTLSWLAINVNPDFLHGKLHHQYGGLVFSGVALALMGALLVILRRGRDRQPEMHPAPAALSIQSRSQKP